MVILREYLNHELTVGKIPGTEFVWNEWKGMDWPGAHSLQAGIFLSTPTLYAHFYFYQMGISTKLVKE